MNTKEQAVKEMWWEGNDFHVITECGEHLIYRNAWFSDIKYSSLPIETENIKIEEFKILKEENNN